MNFKAITQAMEIVSMPKEDVAASEHNLNIVSELFGA